MKIVVLSAVLTLAGCTMPSQEAPYNTSPVTEAEAGGFECTAEPVQYAIGQTANAALAAELMKKSGARTLRWVPPRTAVTMDFRSDRLSVAYDDSMAVTQVSCG